MPVPTCPNCMANLEPIALPRGDTPPWNCVPCARAWWDSELTPQARAAWNPNHRGFDRVVYALVIGPAIGVERVEAVGRGLSFTDVSVEYIPTTQLDALLNALPSGDRRRQTITEARARRQ